MTVRDLETGAIETFDRPAGGACGTADLEAESEGEGPAADQNRKYVATWSWSAEPSFPSLFLLRP